MGLTCYGIIGLSKCGVTTAINGIGSKSSLDCACSYTLPDPGLVTGYGCSQKAIFIMNYTDYLKSPDWQAFRKKVLSFWGERCAICYSKDRVEVHHRTYERLGQEMITDCLALCADCHKLHHNFSGHFLREVYTEVRGSE